ncbi:hypothetical protein F8S13_02105 [Chloroflexia bacterium SDU3-3]|nr:hypothetical protein F8S13_02105 [Chloroflexia bacterium SDU3-3]
MTTSEPLICARCQQPVTAHPEDYEDFERMHWLCYHLEFEHHADPDVPCDEPICPWWRLAALRAALTRLGHDPQLIIEQAMKERWQL